ncbi:MAG TPA: hypothetical protein VK761_10120 [Solirubrobacteraceae bacterium]|jgi:hypothetical protein|nr:hypothetical protein [Solirubrobacteraceae bacterium]
MNLFSRNATSPSDEEPQDGIASATVASNLIPARKGKVTDETVEMLVEGGFSGEAVALAKDLVAEGGIS